MEFMNFHIDNLTMPEALDRVSHLVENTRQSYVVTPNVDHIVKLQTDIEFLEIYENASLVLADGQPLIWISKLYKRPIKEKISGSDLFPQVCKLAADKGYKMFFLGAAEGVADIAAKNLAGKYQGLSVAGTLSPKPGFENDPDEIRTVVDTVRTASPDILVVALGAPKQEKFLFRNRESLDVPLSILVGAALDFEAGVVKRCPVWMSRCGLEWFYRFCKEPGRMFRRYFIDDMKIVGLIWKYRR